MFKVFQSNQVGEGNSNPHQYSCLENPVDREAWWAAVHRITQSQTRLKRLSMHACIGEGNAWRIPGGLPSMGSHRVGHDWCYSAAAAATVQPSIRSQIPSDILATPLYYFYWNMLTEGEFTIFQNGPFHLQPTIYFIMMAPKLNTFTWDIYW